VTIPKKFELVLKDAGGKPRTLYDGAIKHDATVREGLSGIYVIRPQRRMAVIQARLLPDATIVDQLLLMEGEVEPFEFALQAFRYGPVLGSVVNGDLYRLTPSLSAWWYGIVQQCA